jgi:hypothetical protein
MYLARYVMDLVFIRTQHCVIGGKRGLGRGPGNTIPSFSHLSWPVCGEGPPRLYRVWIWTSPCLSSPTRFTNCRELPSVIQRVGYPISGSIDQLGACCNYWNNSQLYYCSEYLPTYLGGNDRHDNPYLPELSIIPIIITIITICF